MSKFQKRHYQAIAEAMQWALKDASNEKEVAGIWKAINHMADTFSADNGNFNRPLFLAAATPGANVYARTADGALKAIAEKHLLAGQSNRKEVNGNAPQTNADQN